jgi:autotransporter-associated beta strand protein
LILPVTLNLDAAISNTTSLSVSGTSNLGANVATTGTQTYSDDVTISADISLNTSGGDVTFDGDVTSAVSGSSSSLIYYTTTPKRNGSGNIVYETGYGLGGSDAAASFSGDIDTVTYRMEYELGGTTYYAEATFDSWDGLTISDLKIPDFSSTALAIQRVVNNMSVSSNIDSTYNSTYGSSGVTTGSGKSGVLEIWYGNYAANTNIGGIGGSSSNFDYNDTRSASNSYGSFQVHNLTDTETVFAWNRHADNKPDVGFGNNTNSQHSDWTFQNNYNNETWALKVSVNNSVASNNLTISTGSGAVDINGAVANVGTLSITSNSTSSEASGIISTDTILTKAGSGTLLLSANNTYTGQTNINAGTLAVTVNNALGTNAAGTVIASGATLDLQNVTYSTTEAITNNGGTLSTSTGTSSFAGVMTLGANSTIDVDGTQLTVSTAIGDGSNGYDIDKTGNGILVLSGANSYSGDTTVSAGTIKLTGSVNALTDLTIASGATLDLQATQTFATLDLRWHHLEFYWFIRVNDNRYL